ncbi:MAG: hypothetical protein RL885_05650 [Planctomycetota bacterium]
MELKEGLTADFRSGDTRSAQKHIEALGRHCGESDALTALSAIASWLDDPSAEVDAPAGTPGSLVAQLVALEQGTAMPRSRVQHSGKLAALARDLSADKSTTRSGREVEKLIAQGELSPAFEVTARQLLIARDVAKGDLDSAESWLDGLKDADRARCEGLIAAGRVDDSEGRQDLRSIARMLRPTEKATVEQRRSFAKVQIARGNRHAALDELDKAHILWREAYQAGSRQPDLLQNLAISAEALEGEVAAVPYWHQLVQELRRRDPRGTEKTAPRLFEAEKQLARLLMRQQSEEALGLLERLAKRARKPELILENLAEQLLAHGQPRRAAPVLRHLIDRYGETATRHARLAQALESLAPFHRRKPDAEDKQANREAKVLAHLRRAVELAPEDASLRSRLDEARYAVIRRLEDFGRFEESLAVVNEILLEADDKEVEPPGTAKLLAARLEYRLGNETLAEGMLESYGENGNAESWLEVAEQYLELGLIKEASRCFENARKGSSSPIVLGQILISYLQHGYDQIARRWSLQASRIRPSELTALIGRIRPHSPEIARDLGQKALRRGGQDPVLHLHLGRAALDCKDKEAALESLTAGRSLLEDEVRPDKKELLAAFSQLEARLNQKPRQNGRGGFRPRGSGGRRR